MQSRSNCPAAAAQAAAAQAADAQAAAPTTSTDARRLLFRSVSDRVLSDDF